jgi:hypothetical protein
MYRLLSNPVQTFTYDHLRNTTNAPENISNGAEIVLLNGNANVATCTSFIDVKESTIANVCLILHSGEEL